MGTDAYTVGERDLALGLPVLRQLAKRASFPFLAANLHDADGRPVFAGSTVKTVAGLKVGILGLLGKETGAPTEILSAAKLTLVDPVATAKAEVARLRQDGAELIVLLSHLGRRETDAVARAVPEIGLVVGGHTGRTIRAPKRVGLASPAKGEAGKAAPPPAETAGVLHVSAGSRGKFLGRLELTLGSPGPGRLDFQNGGGRGELEEEVKNQERSLERLRKQLAELEDKPLPSPEELAKRQEQRIAGITRAQERARQRIAELEGQLKTAKAGPDRERLDRQLKSFRRSLEHNAKRLERTKQDQPTLETETARRAARTKSLTSALERGAARLADARKRLADFRAPGGGQALYVNHLEGLKTSITGEPSIEQRIKKLEGSGLLKPSAPPLPRADGAPLRPQPLPIPRPVAPPPAKR